MRRILMIMLGMLMISSQLLAQNRTINGRVTDDKGNPLPNVSVQVKGTTVGTTTRADGTYTISVPAGAKTLVFSSVGWGSDEMAIGSGSQMNMNLKTEDKAMEDVVVVGYQTVRKRDVGGAISNIKASDIEHIPNANVAQALQGRAAGVIVANANGIPGGSLSVIIRGVGSISAGTTPLYVVDGVQINTALGSINTQNNPLNFLNPDDVESIEVLKDAAAASIYGARAGNGVILITTKKGKMGKTKFSINAYTGTSSPLNVPEVLNAQEWYNVRYEALANANPTSSAAAIRNTVLSNMGLPSTTTQGKVDSLPSYDWQDAVFGRGKIMNMEGSLQGGTQNVNYYLSGSFTKMSAFIAPTDMQRAALFSKIGFKFNDKVSLENSINVSTVSQNAPYSTGNTGFGNPAYAAGQILPNNPIFNADGSFYGMPGSGQAISGTLNHNILAIGEYVKYATRTNQLVGSSALTYTPLPSLTFRGMVGLDYRLTQDHRYQDPRINDAFAVAGRLSDQSDWNTNFITNATANYRKIFADIHSLNLLGGVEFRRDNNQWFEADGQGFGSYLLQYMSAAATASGVSGAWNQSATFSQFGRLGYTFNSKYGLTYTVRRDGSSRFGPNNKYGVFQSVQLTWNAISEDFMRNQNVVSDLKFRYAFGQTGNDQINNTLFRQLYGASRVYGNSGGLNPTQLGNPDLKWETREESNVGMDLGFLRNRITLVVDAYRRVNKDLLLSRSLYSTTGFTSITQNLGAVENKGLELMLKVVPFNRAFRWETSFNIAFQKNKVLSLYDGLDALPSDAATRVGEPLGAFYTSQWAGVNPANGRGMWYDANGNITYNPTAADRKIIGNIYPTHFGGLNNEFSYKGFSLEAFFQYEYGRVRSNGQYTQWMRMGGTTANVIKSGYDARWTTPGQVTAVPRPFNGQTDFNSVSWASGSRFLYKTDYIRLKNLTLAYDMASSTMKRLGLDGAKFYIQGNNIWTYTEWEGYDPEFTGDNFGIIPPSKNVTVGVQVKF
jgi:TonB-dependent starch-binding outer membrane protein SusC